MNSLIYLVFIVVLFTNYDVLGSPSIIQVKQRLSNSLSDTNNYFKHKVRLTNQEGLCSGTIISNMFVLTAAHCVILKGTSNIINIDKQLMEVTVGIREVNNDSEFHTVRLVETIYLPRYFFNTPNTDDNLRKMIGDIAVLKLNYGLGLGKDPRIEALRLPRQEYKNADYPWKNHIMFTGFGGTKAVYNPDIGDYQPAEFPMYSQYSLAEVLPSYSCSLLGNPYLKMCVKLLNPGAGICGGDSGGALIHLEEKTVIGVLSYGAKTCNQATPATYTRVFPYLSFIINAMNDFPDDITRRESFKEHPNYQKALRENRYRYHWIYIPNVISDNAFNG